MKFTLRVLWAALASSADATSVKMDFLPIAHVRTDPIVSQDCLSDHVHTFYGPSAVETIRPEMTYEDLISTMPQQNTGNVEENRFLYWHPSVYSYDKSTDTYTRDAMAQSSAYYIWANEFGTLAFPKGFRMIAGLDPDGPANFPNANAECVGESPCQKDDCDTTNAFFPSTACEELEVSMSMPTCWDGRLDSPDHTSHVHYTLDGEFDGECPDSHPLRIPPIQLFFRIAPYDGGHHTFSDGSSVFHADYVSGWDPSFLQNVIDTCENDSFAANPWAFCEDFLTFRDAPKCTDEDSCDFGDPALLEKLRQIQPPPLDVVTTVTSEETQLITGNLPRGTCTGNLIPRAGATTPSPITSPATSPPTSAPTSPTANCVNDVTWIFITNKGGRKKCNWVARRAWRRCSKEGVDGRLASEACPEECDDVCAS